MEDKTPNTISDIVAMWHAGKFFSEENLRQILTTLIQNKIGEIEDEENTRTSLDDENENFYQMGRNAGLKKSIQILQNTLK